MNKKLPKEYYDSEGRTGRYLLVGILIVFIAALIVSPLLDDIGSLYLRLFTNIGLIGSLIMYYTLVTNFGNKKLRELIEEVN